MRGTPCWGDTGRGTQVCPISILMGKTGQPTPSLVRLTKRLPETYSCSDRGLSSTWGREGDPLGALMWGPPPRHPSCSVPITHKAAAARPQPQSLLIPAGPPAQGRVCTSSALPICGCQRPSCPSAPSCLPGSRRGRSHMPPAPGSGGGRKAEEGGGRERRVEEGHGMGWPHSPAGSAAGSLAGGRSPGSPCGAARCWHHPTGILSAPPQWDPPGTAPSRSCLHPTGHHCHHLVPQFPSLCKALGCPDEGCCHGGKLAP